MLPQLAGTQPLDTLAALCFAALAALCFTLVFTGLRMWPVDVGGRRGRLPVFTLGDPVRR